MPPPAATLWLLRNFGEEQPIMPEKAHNPLSAAGARRQRAYKTSEINISLSVLATNEQYHQMCGRTNVMPPLATKRCTVIPPPVSDETRHPFQSIPPSEATSLSETSLQQG
jgi:hypothetical protein